MSEASYDNRSRWRHAVLSLIAIFSLTLVISALSLKFLPSAFIWIDLTWAVALVAALYCWPSPWPRGSSLYLQGTLWRSMVFSVSVMLVTLAAAEWFFSRRERFFLPASFDVPFYLRDDALGTVPPKGVKVRATSKSYDVTYTIDANGLRVAPPERQKESVGCILFFGDSTMFGHGLEDNQTLPYQVGIQSGGRYRIFNFAFEGYGPHQMLSAIESGRVSRIVDCQPKYAIYLAITDHVRRVTGKIPYGKHSPRYVLNPEGTVRRDGDFETKEQPTSGFRAELRQQLEKSAIYRLWSTSRGPLVSAADIDLMLAIVRQSRDLLRAEYPGIQFHVILGVPVKGTDREIYSDLVEGFGEMGVHFEQEKDMLPELVSNPRKYALSAYDRHPNALADHLLAAYVVAHFLSEETQAVGTHAESLDRRNPD